MAEIVTDDNQRSSEYETSEVSGSSESLDLSCIHWGYLNCTLVTDPKKIKENVWQTYWVDLCGSTIRLYRDLSLPPDSATKLPPSSLIGPSNENEKKEAFIILKKGTDIAIVEPEIEPYKSRKRLRINKRHTFKVAFPKKGSSYPAYVFQAPSKGSMYRWISKIEEGIDMADKPQNESATEKKLSEAKLLTLEQRRLNRAPKFDRSYLDKDDADSGMEGDVEEAYEVSKKTFEELRLEDLKKRLQEKEQLIRQLDLEERSFLGPENSSLVKRCEFRSMTNRDYYLVPGSKHSLVPKGSELTILGQLSNNRWRCFVELPRNLSTGCVNKSHSEASSEVESASSFDISDASGSDLRTEKETLIGSVPSSILLELRSPTAANLGLKYDDGTPVASPGETPQLSPLPSPPLSPYSPHKGDRTSLQNRSSLRRSIASENLIEHDAWEQFCIPSPPSSPATSRSTSPSLSLSGSRIGSLEELDFDAKTTGEGSPWSATVEGNEHISPVTLRAGANARRGRNGLITRSHREAIMMDNSVENCTDSQLYYDRMVTVIDVVPPEDVPSVTEEFAHETVEMQVKQRQTTNEASDNSPGEQPRNYAFLVTKKLRQRGISLIVGSSSSEDEGDDGEGRGLCEKISQRKLEKEFTRFDEERAEKGTEIRPYSAFVTRKRAGINLSTGSPNFAPRTCMRDELLRDYSSSSDKQPVQRSHTCTKIGKLGDWSSPENAPPINQRRTLQLSKGSLEGFGFTLQTYGIVQQDGQVEYMTFVLNVQEDSSAYMAGLRPGDIILEADGKNVEDVDHKDVVTLIQQASLSLRLVVVFVDALRRMKLNTRLKILSAELENREAQFDELCQKEDAILKGRGGADLSLPSLELIHSRDKINSYLYTTELTSSFSKESPEVHDSLLQYRQSAHDRPRPSSLAGQSELSKQSIVATTGSQMLRSFASPDQGVQRRTLSTKLMKTFAKKRKSVESFKSYVDVEAFGPGQDDKADETGSDTSSLSSASGLSDSFASPGEPTIAISTAVETKTMPCEFTIPQGPTAEVVVPPTPLENTTQNLEEMAINSPKLRKGLGISEITNVSRISPGIAEMHRRFEKSATGRYPTSNTSRSVPVNEGGSSS